MTTVLIMMQIAAELGLAVAPIDCELFVHQPEGWKWMEMGKGD